MRHLRPSLQNYCYDIKMTRPAIYIFRGAPASGKGTLLPKFCELLPAPVALIEQDQFRWGLHLIGRSVPDISDEEHAFAHQNTLLMYEQYLKNGRYTIVLEGLFTWDNSASSQGSTKEFIELALAYGYPYKSIVLKADKEELLKRNALRPYSVPRDEFETLYSTIYEVIGPDEIVIDSSSQNIEQTLHSLRQIIL
jgi:predicted kinase